MNQTLLKYSRIQQFYLELQRHKCFSHAFCEALICSFFHIQGVSTVSRILGENVPSDVRYEFESLDFLWIKEYIKTHLKKTTNEEFEFKS